MKMFFENNENLNCKHLNACEEITENYYTNEDKNKTANLSSDVDENCSIKISYNDDNVSNNESDSGKVLDKSTSRENKSVPKTIYINRKLDKYGFSIKNYTIYNSETKKASSLTYISYVEKNGPADLSGLIKGNILFSINNCRLSNFSYERIHYILQLATSPLKLIIYDDDNFKTINLIKLQIKLNNELNAKVVELERLENLESSLIKTEVSDFEDSVNTSLSTHFIEPIWNLVSSSPSTKSQENTQMTDTPFPILRYLDGSNIMSNLAASNLSLPVHKRNKLLKTRPTLSLPNGYLTIGGKTTRSLESSPYIHKKTESLRSDNSDSKNSIVTTLKRKFLKPVVSCRSSTWYFPSNYESIPEAIKSLNDSSSKTESSPNKDVPLDDNNNGKIGKKKKVPTATLR